jgi:hypothetical protein
MYAGNRQSFIFCRRSLACTRSFLAFLRAEAPNINGSVVCSCYVVRIVLEVMLAMLRSLTLEPHLSPNSSATGRTRHGGTSLAMGTCRGTARPWTQAPLLLVADSLDWAFCLDAAAAAAEGSLLVLVPFVPLLLLVLAALCVLQAAQ